MNSKNEISAIRIFEKNFCANIIDELKPYIDEKSLAKLSASIINNSTHITAKEIINLTELSYYKIHAAEQELKGETAIRNNLPKIICSKSFEDKYEKIITLLNKTLKARTPIQNSEYLIWKPFSIRLLERTLKQYNVNISDKTLAKILNFMNYKIPPKETALRTRTDPESKMMSDTKHERVQQVGNLVNLLDHCFNYNIPVLSLNIIQKSESKKKKISSSPEPWNDVITFLPEIIRRWILNSKKGNKKFSSEILIIFENSTLNNGNDKILEENFQPLVNELGHKLVFSHLPPGIYKWINSKIKLTTTINFQYENASNESYIINLSQIYPDELVP